MPPNELLIEGRDYGRYWRLYDQESDVSGAGFEAQFGGVPALSEGGAYVGDAVSLREWKLPLLLKAREAAVTNLVTNPRFAKDTTGWFSDGNYLGGGATTLTRFADPDAPAGDYVGKVVTSANNFQGAGHDLTLTAGQTYRIRLRVKRDAGGAALQVKVGENFGGFIETQLATGLAPSSTSYDDLSYSFTATNTGSHRLFVRTTAATVTTFYVNAVLVAQSASDVAYFDGDDLDAGWTGDAHASTSVSFAGVDGVHSMIAKAHGDLQQGAEVKFTPEGATNASHFDLERGKLEADWQHPLSRKGYVKAELRLWTRPYATTGTTRLVASVSGTGPLQFAATGIIGDERAEGLLEVRVGSVFAGGGRLVAYGVHANPSYVAVHPGASQNHGVIAATVVGASGAVASRYIGYYVAATAAMSNGAPYYFYLGPEYAGQHRLLGIVRARVHPPTAVHFQMTVYDSDAVGNVGATVGATVNSGPWQVVDLGDVDVPRQVGSRVATQQVRLDMGGASGASAIASPAFHVNALVLVPVEESVGFVLAASHANDTAARQRFIFDAVDRQVIRGTASTMLANQVGALRGEPPLVPPTGSPMASGGLSVVALQGDANNFVGNDLIDVSLSVRERWSFLH